MQSKVLIGMTLVVTGPSCQGAGGIPLHPGCDRPRAHAGSTQGGDLVQQRGGRCVTDQAAQLLPLQQLADEAGVG